MSKALFERYKVSFKKGEHVFRDGEIGADMYIVQSGRIRLTKRVVHGDHVLATLEKGDFFGEMAVLENLPRTATAEALEDSELIAINGSTFDKMIKSNIEIAVRMLRKFSAKLRDADAQIVDLLTEREARPEVPMVPAAPQLLEPEPLAAREGPPPVVPATPIAMGVASRPRALLGVKGTSRVVPMLSDDITIGRTDPVTGLTPEVDLTHEDVNRFISRRHAKILFKNETFYLVEEVGVTNGTYLNGKRLQAGVFTPIQYGDELCFGKVFMVFEKPPE